MAKAKAKQAPAPSPTFSGKRGRRRPFLGTLCLIASIMMLISLIDYNEFQNWRFHDPVQQTNLGGEVGVNIAYHSMNSLGWAAYTLPFYALWLGYMLFFRHAHRLRIGRIASLFLSVVSLCVLLTLAEHHLVIEASERDHGFVSNTFPHGMGGFTGHTLYRSYLAASIGPGGTVVVFTIFLLFSIGYLTHDNVFSSMQRLRPALQPWLDRRRENARIRREARAARQAERARRRAEARAEEKAETAARKADRSAGTEESEEDDISVSRDLIPRRPRPQADRDGDGSGDSDRDESPEEVGALPERPAEPKANGSRSKRAQRAANEPHEEGKQLTIIKGEQVRKAARPVPEKKGDYAFPPLTLLRDPDPEPETQSPENHQRTAEILVRTLGEFGVKVTMGEVHTGPVITRYDVTPAAGVRVEKIVNLDKNLSLALKALSVRILAPVPGKGCVGIEVPNAKPQAVYIRDILESEDWVSHKGEIPIALGKEVSGKPLVTDLTRMPHLLIAGSTGAGKTVCINAIITSLLYHSSPEDLRFVMVDPKIVELQAYNALPHMLIPVVTDPKKVPGALKYLLNEMDRRYHLFASVGARNIAGYNAKTARKSDPEADEHARELEQELSPEERAAVSSIEVRRDRNVDLPDKKLPYIVVIIDELADLMMVAPADIETGIARLAQLARAAGIHLIIATQRPSVNVITGVIKANLPSRISFKVAAKVDSRTILDTMGADHLIGRGDMLFLAPGSSDLIRAQGAFIGDDEINGIIDFLKRNGEPEFDEEFQRSVEEAIDDANGEGDDFGDDDEMLAPALEVLRSTKRASTSMLQRRLKIGYNRAARIMETLEDRGIVGPDNGSQPREILKDLDSL